MFDSAFCVRQVIARELKKDIACVQDDCTLVENLGIGEFERLAITAELEILFDITVPDADMDGWTTVADIVATMARLASAREQAA